MSEKVRVPCVRSLGGAYEHARLPNVAKHPTFQCALVPPLGALQRCSPARVTRAAVRGLRHPRAQGPPTPGRGSGARLQHWAIPILFLKTQMCASRTYEETSKDHCEASPVR